MSFFHKMKKNKQFQLSRFFNLIRALFPRWSFFDRLGHTYELHFRQTPEQVWQLVSFEQSRTWPQFFVGLIFNPTLNEALAQFNIIEHFVQDLQEYKKTETFSENFNISNLTTYKMLITLLKIKMKSLSQQTHKSSLQFQIIARSSTEILEVYCSDFFLLESDAST